MEKLDLTKLYRNYFTADLTPELVDMEEARFLSITGKGDPSGQEFTDNIQALYAAAYGVKFTYKALNKDFIVSKLEGLWWFDENTAGKFSMAEILQKVERSKWEYRLLIRMPEFVSHTITNRAIETVVAKKQFQKSEDVELITLNEGKCVQVLHVGPFAAEPETLTRIESYMHKNGLSKNGLHHEIYLSDFKKTAPEKLRTILREPVI